MAVKKKMPKHEMVLRFDMDEHKADAILAFRGADLWHRVYDFQRWLRDRNKYGKPHKTGAEELEEIRKWFQPISDLMWEIEEEGVN